MEFHIFFLIYGALDDHSDRRNLKLKKKKCVKSVLFESFYSLTSKRMSSGWEKLLHNLKICIFVLFC